MQSSTERTVATKIKLTLHFVQPGMQNGHEKDGQLKVPCDGHSKVRTLLGCLYSLSAYSCMHGALSACQNGNGACP